MGGERKEGLCVYDAMGTTKRRGLNTRKKQNKNFYLYNVFLYYDLKEVVRGVKILELLKVQSLTQFEKFLERKGRSRY